MPWTERHSTDRDVFRAFGDMIKPGDVTAPLCIVFKSLLLVLPSRSAALRDVAGDVIGDVRTNQWSRRNFAPR